MRRVEHVGGERLRPRVAVEARADERAVLVPPVARVGRGVDREHRRACPRARASRIAPRCVALHGVSPIVNSASARASRSVGRVERAHVVDPLRPQAVQLGDLRDADRGLVEHAVHARRTVGVRRDLGDEQQAIGHSPPTLSASPEAGRLREREHLGPTGRASDW